MFNLPPEYHSSGNVITLFVCLFISGRTETKQCNHLICLFQDELKQKQKEMADRLDLYPDPDALNDFVTWEGLENALKGVREELQPKENVVIEQGQQTVR